MATQAVNFITGNKNKLAEVKAILEPTITVENHALDLIEVQGTLEDVTMAKCQSAAEQVHVFSRARTLSSQPAHFQMSQWTLTNTWFRSEAPSLWRTHVSVSTR